MQGTERVSRRAFMRRAAVAGAATAGLTILGATARGQEKVIKAGLVGCGGRGGGAARDFLEAGKFLKLNVQIAAVADSMQDRAEGAGKGLGVPAERIFVGFDAYKKLLDTDVDVMINATSPNFRPVHFAAAIKAGKHVFFEKPAAVDPPGARTIMEAGKLAAEKKLNVVAGTQRRHSQGYQQHAKVVLEDKVIGRILGGLVSWCGGALWFRRREAAWSNREYLVRNWVSFAEMSGDHLIEQHVHNLDVLRWFMGTPPVAVVGFGGRARRQTGNQFDFHSLDFEFPGGVHVHSVCRQVNGCWGGVFEHLVGEKGTTGCGGGTKPNDNVKLDFPPFDGHGNPYVNEHVDLLKGILDEKKYINEAQNVAEATMMAVMGRMSGYTGQRVAWSEVMDPNHAMGKFACEPTAAAFEQGEVPVPKEEPAVPGKD
jgi:predicted dehydrogenase